MSDRAYFNGIKECPKCRSRLADTVSFWATNEEPDQHLVQCPNCKEEGPIRSTASAALRAWNTDRNFKEIQ